MQEQEAFKQFSQHIRSASFPVYGLTHRLTDFSLVSFGEGRFGEPPVLNSISLTFSSPSYLRAHDCFHVSTSNSAPQPNAVARIITELKDPSEGAIFDLDTPLFRGYHLDESVQAQAGSPRLWDEAVSIADVSFSTKIRHWPVPYSLSLFLLKSENIVLSGKAYGPSLKELLTILQGLNVVNGRDDVLLHYRDQLGRA